MVGCMAKTYNLPFFLNKYFSDINIFCNLAARNETLKKMNNLLSFAQLKFDVWLIEQLQTTNIPGLTLEELNQRWMNSPGHSGGLSRDKLTKHRKNIELFLGVKIETPDRKHYRITNPEDLSLDSLANDLLKSIQNYTFLQEYKELGNQIQPEQIETGSRYLEQIGQALRDKRKLRIRYQKFTDTVPYEATLHPYCLKADKGRWYLLAYKEESDNKEVYKCFALDRTLQLSLLSETFSPNPRFDVSSYFHDCFGVWHDFEKYPVRDITISCTKKVAQYLRTLPLHHSQKEDPFKKGKEERILFHYHISPSPDFIAEIKKWGDEARVEE